LCRTVTNSRLSAETRGQLKLHRVCCPCTTSVEAVVASRIFLVAGATLSVQAEVRLRTVQNHFPFSTELLILPPQKQRVVLPSRPPAVF
jgi:hypothetical protein